MTDMKTKARELWREIGEIFLGGLPEDMMPAINKALTEAHREGMEEGRKNPDWDSAVEASVGGAHDIRRKMRNAGMEEAAKVGEFAHSAGHSNACDQGSCWCLEIVAAIREKIKE